MIITGKDGLNIINGEPQPHGVDIQVKNVYYIIRKDIDEKVTDDDYIPVVKMRDSEGRYYWNLFPNEPVLFELDITDLSKENVGKPIVGYVLPKSRFLRRGIIVHSALFDFGFVGKGKILAVNTSGSIHKIYQDMYFGQIVFFDGKNGNMIYNGSHQKEGIDCSK